MGHVAIDPRKGKGNRRLCYNLTDFFREYKKECRRQYGAGFATRMVPRDKFLSILTMYLKELMINIIRERSSFRMPKRLGELGVVKRKCTNGVKQERRVSFPQVNEENREKVLFFAQNHYTGHYFKIKWKKLNARGTLRFVGWFSFIPTRSAKTYLSDHIYDCAKDPMVKNYDAPDDVSVPVRNPLELPAP